MRRSLPAAVALLALGASACGTAAEAPRPAADRRAAVPAPVERYVHRTFHGLSRICGPRRADRDRLDRTTARFLGLYRRYPPARYRVKIDDESGTMLSATLVLREALAECSPRHAARLDPVVPARIRRALRPLGTPRPRRRSPR